MTRRRAVRGALLAVVLSAGVILGLLGMHALDGHGMGHGAVAAHGQTAEGAGAVSAGHGAVDAHAGSSVRGAPTEAVGAIIAVAAPAAAPQSHDPAATAGLGLTCVLALLAGLLLLTRPRMAPISGVTSAPSVPPLRLLSRPPRRLSLHELCISRR